MAYQAVPTVATGDLWTAANHNTYLRDNLAEIFGGAAAGALPYFSSANALAKLLKPGFDGILQNTAAGVLSWIAKSTFVTSLLAKRQGGSATNWSTQGTTSYTPATSKRQSGVIRVSGISNQLWSATLTFPEPFTNVPIVKVSSTVFYMMATSFNPSTTQVTIRVYVITGAASGDCDVNWEAEAD